MKLRIPLQDVKDQLIVFLSEGFSIVGHCFNDNQDIDIREILNVWFAKVNKYLLETFPTQKESGQFAYTTGTQYGYSQMSVDAAHVVNTMNIRIAALRDILNTLSSYYQFEPDSLRLFVNQIDSFTLVRGINHAEVAPYLDNGSIQTSEEDIKRAFVSIIGESFIPKDHGGETEDLFTSRVIFNGERVQTSFILKGPGTLKHPTARVADFGSNGDQIERMFRTTSSIIYFVHAVKNVDQDVIHTLDAFVTTHRNRGIHCYYCVIDGQDTAEILFAYGYTDLLIPVSLKISPQGKGSRIKKSKDEQ
jgi:hypothetical protein